MFEKLNGYKKTVRDGIELGSLPFKPLKDFAGKTVFVDGFFFNNGKYGKQVVVVGNGAKINMPARAVEQFTEILNDDEMLKAVLDGMLCLIDIKQVNTKNGATIAYTFKTR